MVEMNAHIVAKKRADINTNLHLPIGTLETIANSANNCAQRIDLVADYIFRAGRLSGLDISSAASQITIENIGIFTEGALGNSETKTYWQIRQRYRKETEELRQKYNMQFMPIDLVRERAAQKMGSSYINPVVDRNPWRVPFSADDINSGVRLPVITEEIAFLIGYVTACTTLSMNSHSTFILHHALDANNTTYENNYVIPALEQSFRTNMVSCEAATGDGKNRAGTQRIFSRAIVNMFDKGLKFTPTHRGRTFPDYIDVHERCAKVIAGDFARLELASMLGFLARRFDLCSSTLGKYNYTYPAASVGAYRPQNGNDHMLATQIRNTSRDNGLEMRYLPSAARVRLTISSYRKFLKTDPHLQLTGDMPHRGMLYGPLAIENS